MSDITVALLTLALPLLTAWALRAALPRRWRWLAIFPLIMAALQALLIVSYFSCSGGEGAPVTCTPDALTPVFTALLPLLMQNLTGLLVLCPGLLIVSGIAALVRRERHED